jgi:cell division protein FtsN
MIHQRNRQTGGTLLGFIVGLILGLGIAVAVALTIKNSPLPFVDRAPKHNADPGQVVDPNRPLYGNRDPAKEAAKDAAKQLKQADLPPTSPSDPIDKIIAPKPEQNAPAKTPEAKAPIEDKSTPAKTEQDKGALDKSDEKFTYYLQAGAFLEQADAENTKAKLALLGVAASISERQTDNGILYRVRIGPFAQQEVMNRMRGKLSDNGVDAAIIRMPK